MYPIGHIAFAYLVWNLAVHRRLSPLAFGALAFGAVLPAFANEGLQLTSVVPIHPWWSHSPLTLVALWLAYASARRVFRSQAVTQYLLLFTVGYTCHLLSDPVCDMLLLFFSRGTTDVGESWLFPFFNVVITHPHLTPGFVVWPWKLAVESAGLSVAVAHWTWQTWRPRSAKPAAAVAEPLA